MEEGLAVIAQALQMGYIDPLSPSGWLSWVQGASLHEQERTETGALRSFLLPEACVTASSARSSLLRSDSP
jgi:hypothetical protein